MAFPGLLLLGIECHVNNFNLIANRTLLVPSSVLDFPVAAVAQRESRAILVSTPVKVWGALALCHLDRDVCSSTSNASGQITLFIRHISHCLSLERAGWDRNAAGHVPALNPVTP